MGSLPKDQSERADDLPVVNVSHDDIKRRFLPALARLAPALLPRLPSEAEWEMAARVGTTTAYHWGDAPFHDDMNFRALEKQNVGRLLAARYFNTNVWGLWQMHGNVYEWCSDAFARYQAAEARDPRTQKGDRRVLRGGSWRDFARYSRSAFRGVDRSGDRNLSFGFRLARGLAEAGHAHSPSDQAQRDVSRPRSPRAARKATLKKK